MWIYERRCQLASVNHKCGRSGSWLHGSGKKSRSRKTIDETVVWIWVSIILRKLVLQTYQQTSGLAPDQIIGRDNVKTQCLLQNQIWFLIFVTKSNLELQNQIWRCKIKIGVAKSNWRCKIEFGNIWRCKIKVWRCKIKFGIAKIEFIKLFTRHGPFGLLHSGTPNLYELMQELVPSMPQS